MKKKIMNAHYPKYTVCVMVIFCLVVQLSLVSLAAGRDNPSSAIRQIVTLKDAYSLSSAGDSLYQLKATLTTKSSQAPAAEGIKVVLDIENAGQVAVRFDNPLDLIYFNLYNAKDEALPLPEVTSRLTIRTGHAAGMESVPDPLRLSFKVLGASLDKKILGPRAISQYVFVIAPHQHLQFATSIDRIRGQTFISNPLDSATSPFKSPKDISLPPGEYQLQIGVPLTSPHDNGNYRTLLSPIVQVNLNQSAWNTKSHLRESSNEGIGSALKVLDGGGTERFAIGYSQYDFGEALSTDTHLFHHMFLVKNISDEPILIERIATSCGCTEAYIGEDKLRSLPFRLKPHETIKVNAALNPHTEAPGNVSKYVWLFGRQHTPLTATMALTGTVVLLK